MMSNNNEKVQYMKHNKTAECELTTMTETATQYA